MKRFKMLLYGEPGVGKSVFASKAPKPYFVTTDGNYEFLEEFGAKPEAHTQVNSWNEAKKLFASNAFDNYETIVVDLLEDLFKWCEYEYCARNRIDHVSDIGYGKGYDSSRNEFFIEICKLLGLEKNVILIMHGMTYMEKDRRGVEHPKHVPSSRLPDKVLDMIEGRVRYCLRCYLKDEEQENGVLVKKRFLSLVPKPNEFGIIRGIDENAVPHDIPLDFDCFANVIGLDMNSDKNPEPAKKTEVKKSVEKKTDIKKDEAKDDVQPDVETTVEDIATSNESGNKSEATQPALETETDASENVVEETATVAEAAEAVEKANDAVEETSTEVTQPSQPVPQPAETKIDNNDKLAAIRAKLAAINSK